MSVRDIGIRDVSQIEGISIKKALSVLVKSSYVRKPKYTHYASLEIDEFWTHVQQKSKKVWLIYAYDRLSGEIVTYVWGKRNLKTARALRKKLTELGITYTKFCTDDWQSFVTAFKEDDLIIKKANTVRIEDNNYKLRHRIKRAFRKTYCFSKKMKNHLKAFDIAFFYINWGYV